MKLKPKDKGRSHAADVGRVVEGGICAADNSISLYVWWGIKMSDGAAAQDEDTNTALSFLTTGRKNAISGKCVVAGFNNKKKARNQKWEKRFD